MTKHLKTLIFLAAGLLLATAAAAAQDKATDEALALLRNYDAAWNRKDAKTVGSILADDYVYFSSRGGTSTRKETLDFLASPKYVIKSAARSEIKAFRTGDAVVVSSRWKGDLVYNDETINDDQRCSLVFAKARKSWRLLSEHCTQIVESR